VKRLVRNPDLLVCWRGRELLVEDLGTGSEVVASADALALLHLFGRARSAEDAARALPDYDRGSVLRSVGKLARLGLLVPEDAGRSRRARIRAWRENLASAYYHAASRDIRYTTSPRAVDRLLQTRAAAERQPPRFKRYRNVATRRLPKRPARENGISLDRALALRRTVRSFLSAPVSLQDLAGIVRGTWGRTGWLDAGALGRFALKTSPSGGSLHPIECYVLAWNVRGLESGLYHYDVLADALRRLRAGDFRNDAVRAASGQRWVGRAAFLCVMTAVFERTLWKYQQENAYRVLWLDAGHLAQTFCLLATARGLGPFTTAAIQDSYIEKLIGLDGIREFPVYLCGAGIPANRASGKRLSPG
jgi:SagB-type dehydrogenase family enzyme